jgi:Mn2+/Fe2+ NRAMP family transporter
MLVGFMVIALSVFLVVGQPVKTLVVVGALNGFILPIALTLILFAASNQKIVGEYKHPMWLKLFGIAVIVATLYMSVRTIFQML